MSWMNSIVRARMILKMVEVGQAALHQEDQTIVNAMVDEALKVGPDEDIVALGWEVLAQIR